MWPGNFGEETLWLALVANSAVEGFHHFGSQDRIAAAVLTSVVDHCLLIAHASV